MKTRIISSLVGVLIMVAVLFGFYLPFVIEIVVMLLSGLAVYELLKETKIAADPFLFVPGILLAFWIPFSFHFDAGVAILPPAIILFYLFLVLLKKHDTVHFNQVATTFFAPLMISLCFSSILIFRDRVQPHGIYYVLAALGGAWFSDIGAYFIGCKFGKHKLAPKISPKKSVEGFFGGIVTAVLGMVLLSFVYSLIYNGLFAGDTKVQVNYLWIILVSLVLAPLGVFGDLSASVIKRQTGIKDFGWIMPGHGGILDRFDSALWTMSALAIFVLQGGQLLS